MFKINQEWDEILRDDFNSDGYKNLREFLKKEYSTRTIYPSMYDVFNSMKTTSFKDIKAVILGQDPYHEEGQAMGLSFSVPNGIPLPPSLKNIYKEIEAETGEKCANNGDLTYLAKQGVLLLNAVLTVRAHSANSHKGMGWEAFTDSIIKKISDGRENVVFILWGAYARSKKMLIDCTKHLILESAHPSPLSAYNGFFGCGHFNKTNQYLINVGKTPIKWSNI